MYKVIVVGTDGSDRAMVAVREALELAKMAGAKLHAVQVVHPAVKSGFSDTAGGQFEIDKLREETERTSAALLAEAEQQGVSAEVHTPAGDVADALIGVAEAVRRRPARRGQPRHERSQAPRARERPQQGLPSLPLQPAHRRHRNQLTHPRAGRQHGERRGRVVERPE
jgi:Universal stress protein family